MGDDATRLIRKLWQYCNVLRDDGLSYPDYVEQLTYLLFLKLSAEQADSPIPEKFNWESFDGKDADNLHGHYSRVLTALGKQPGMLGVIFKNAKNKIKDPAKLRLLIVDMIGQTDWSQLSDDVKGDTYEGLLEKNARDTKSGAGQYFTPRPLIRAIVECVDPRPQEVVCDPACGTGGFLLAAHAYIRSRNPKATGAQKRYLATKAIRGVELVAEVARLAAMNLLLHGISGASAEDLSIQCGDSLLTTPAKQVDIVLTNPPFGVKGSVTYTSKEKSGKAADDLSVVRRDFWVQTANKQLNFLQHVVSLLRPGGRAAVVLPDNVLFEDGVAATVRRRLLESCDVHTLLRLPTGLFYAQGVQANVLFFDRNRKGETTAPDHRLWVYDLRVGSRFSLKTNPLTDKDLTEFTALYRPGNRDERVESSAKVSPVVRWRSFATAELANDEQCRLDVAWQQSQTPRAQGGISRLDEISRAIANDLKRALEQISLVTPPDN